MRRFTWWRMEQVGHHLSRALCGAFCSILHHVKRFLSQPPHVAIRKTVCGKHIEIALKYTTTSDILPLHDVRPK